MNGIKDSCFYLLLLIIPKNFISRIFGRLVEIRLPKIFRPSVNRFVAGILGIDLTEAEKPLNEYASVQELFTRQLNKNARKICKRNNALISPCDGDLVDGGVINKYSKLTIKGRHYRLPQLLSNKGACHKFKGGNFIIIYLSPRDYHRFHVPINGKITATHYLPGHLWPVNPWAVKNIKNLFAINERLISYFTIKNKMMAHVAVGATMVGKIKLAYTDITTNCKRDEKIMRHGGGIECKKGDELGMFKFGSTIILLFEPGLLKSLDLNARHVKMGEEVGVLNI